jgi:hypothetical protein
MHVITCENLKVPKPSNEWLQKLKTSMSAFASPSDPLSACLYDHDWRGRQAVHCLYSVGLKRIIDPRGLEGIEKPFCWRFVAGGHKKMTTAAGCWTTHELHGLEAKVMAAFQGPEMAEMLAHSEQLNQLKELSDHPTEQYDLRVLRIPGLYIEAFWLTCTKRGDLMVPYGLLPDGKGSIKVGATGRLRINQAYPVAEFLKVVREAARQRLAAHDKAPMARQTYA